MQVAYVAGDGLLVGSGHRWVLLDHLPDPATVERLWTLVTGSSDLLAGVAGLLPSTAVDAVAAAELAPGRERSRAWGGASVQAREGEHLLSAGCTDAPGTATELPLTGGAVRAARARLCSKAPRPVAGPPLIDGIPEHLLAGSAAAATGAVTAVPARQPEREPEARTRHRAADPAPRAEAGSTDHDGRTVQHRGPASPLQQSTRETVLAARCPAGHVTPHDAPVCRSCGEPLPAQAPLRLPRPVLGVLRLRDGERVPLDRGVVLGRRPEPRPGVGDWPRLVQLPGDATYLSRVHLQVELDGWHVVARDLGSKAGTTWHVPGQPPVRMRTHDAYLLEPGHVLDLADGYRIAFEVT